VFLGTIVVVQSLVVVQVVLATFPAARAADAAAKPPAKAAPAAIAKPPWPGSKVGITEEVLPPWTPVEAAGDRVSVWGRGYRFGGLPFPAAITARDAEILASPITLAGIVDGKPLAWGNPSCRTSGAKPAAVELATRAESGPLACEGTVRVDYDGMVRCDVRLVPKAGGAKKATLERLVLEVPLRGQHAQYLHTWPGQWGSAANSRALPKQGHRGPFKPFVWLGDAWRGLAWFSESDRNFFTAKSDKGDPVIEIRREGDSVVLRVHLVSVPQAIERPLEYTFGFQATPVKPARPDAWDYRTVHMGSYGLEDRPYTAPGGKKTTLLEHLAASGVRTVVFHEHWTDIQNYPTTTHGEKLKKLVAACHARGIRLLVYFGYEMSNIAPEWDLYHEECLVFPRAGGYKRKPEQTAYIVCYRSHWQDFLAAGIDKALADYDLDGVYLDGTSEPWGCANQRHGCGYRRPDGTVGTTYSFFATRAMMKRIYTIVKARRPDGQVNVHQSTCMTIPTLAFATSYWDGEQLQGLKRDRAALEVLPLDAFCAEFMGHNWGVPAELLWYGNGPFRRVEAMTMGLLHDIPVRPGGMDDLEVSARLWKVHDQFGRHEAAWVPYWESQERKLVSADPPAVKVSLHNRPGRGLLAVVANTGRDACQARVTFNLGPKGLDQPTDLTAYDVVAQREIPFSSSRLEVPLGSLEYAVVWLKPK